MKAMKLVSLLAVSSLAAGAACNSTTAGGDGSVAQSRSALTPTVTSPTDWDIDDFLGPTMANVGRCAQRPLTDPAYVELLAVTTDRAIDGVSYAVIGEPFATTLDYIMGGSADINDRQYTVTLDGQPITFTQKSGFGGARIPITIEADPPIMVTPSTAGLHTLSWVTSCGTLTKTFSVSTTNATAVPVELHATSLSIAPGDETKLFVTGNIDRKSTCQAYRGQLVGRRVSDGAVTFNQTWSSESATISIGHGYGDKPSATTDYTATVTCEAFPSLSTTSSVRVNVVPRQPPPPVCGDGTCNGQETCGNCAGDCGSCPVTPETKPVCAGYQNVPGGWIVVNTKFDPLACGGGSPGSDNIWIITRYDNLPVQYTLSTCMFFGFGNSSVPPGWSQVGTSFDPLRCGGGGVWGSPNVQTIERLN